MAPAKFGFMKSVEILVMVVLGWHGLHVWIRYFRQRFDHTARSSESVADYRMLAYAVVLILVMIFRPKGLCGSMISLLASLNAYEP